MKTYTLEDVQDELVGRKGTPNRERFERELQADLLGYAIRRVRKERRLTQEELGELVGVQKAQISRIENSTGNVTIATLLKVFAALKAQLNFNVDLFSQKTAMLTH